MKFTLTTLAILLVAYGCVSTYQNPVASTPSATVVFRKGYEISFPQGGTQTYGISEREDCGESKRTATFGPMSDDSRSIQVPVRQPVTIFAYAQISAGTFIYGKIGLRSTTCKSQFRFSPEKGHSYDVKQTSSMDEACDISVSDTTARVSVKTLPIGDAPTCKEPDVWQ